MTWCVWYHKIKVVIEETYPHLDTTTVQATVELGYQTGCKLEGLDVTSL